MPRAMVGFVILSLTSPAWAAAPPVCIRDALGEALPRHALLRIGSNRLCAPSLLTAVASSPDGRVAVAAGVNPALYLWDLPSGRLRTQLEDPAGRRLRNPVFSPDGKALAATTCLGESPHNGFCVWDVSSGKLQAAASVSGQQLAGWAFSPDGKLLAGSLEGQGLLLFDASTGRKVRLIDGPGVGQHRIAFSPCGTWVAAPMKDGPVAFFRVATGKVDRTIPADKGAVVLDLAFCPDGRRLAALPQNGGIRVWHLASGKVEVTLSLDTSKAGCRVCFSEGGRVLVALDGKGALLRLDARTGKELSRWEQRRERFDAYVGVATDGKAPVVFAEWGSCKVRLVDLHAGREAGTAIAGHSSPVGLLAVSPDGRKLASTCSTSWNPAIRLWDLTTGRLVCNLEGSDGILSDLVWSPEGNRIASSSQDGSIRLWDARTGRCTTTLSLKEGHHPRLAFSPSGNLLAASGFKNINGRAVGMLWGWNVRPTQQRVMIETESKASGLAFLDERTIATLEGQSVQFRDVESGKPARSSRPTASGGWLCCAAAGGSRLAQLTYDRGLSILEGDTGIELALLPVAPQARVFALSSDGEFLALTAEAGRIEVLDAITGARLAEFRHPSTGLDQSLAFSPDGARLMSGGIDSTVLVWDVRGALRRIATASRLPDPARRREHWAALGSRNPAAVREALLALRTNPKATLQLAEDEVRAGDRSAADEQVRRGIADLDADSFQRREQASKELTKMGESARPLLEKAAREGATAEVKRRAQAVLQLLSPEGLTGGQLRRLRLVRLLERMGGAQARRLLERFAEGSAEDPVVRLASASLHRSRAAASEGR